MGRFKIASQVHICNGIRRVLPGQAKHQIKIDIIESGPVRTLYGFDRLIAVMYAAKFLQLVIFKALDANRQSIDTGRSVI